MDGVMSSARQRLRRRCSSFACAPYAVARAASTDARCATFQQCSFHRVPMLAGGVEDESEGDIILRALRLQPGTDTDSERYNLPLLVAGSEARTPNRIAWHVAITGRIVLSVDAEAHP